MPRPSRLLPARLRARWRRRRSAAAVAVLVCLPAGAVRAEDREAALPFLLVAETISNDAVQRATSFEMIFNQPPDFLSVDEFGRQRHAFQYYIGNAAGPLPVPELPGAGLDLVIRGGEIARTGQLVLRRADGGPAEEGAGAGDPDAGGWGPELAQVPFALRGAGLTFTVPWSALRETDGRFGYGLLLLDHGAASDHRSGTVPPG